MFNDSAPPGKELKYARAEHERRFLLATLPTLEGSRAVEMTDRYIAGTRLRLRRAVEDHKTVYKFTQKVPDSAGGPGLITTIYLNEPEYEALAALPASVLTKVRHSIPPLGVDVFQGALSGLYLAEVEFDTADESAKYSAPAFIAAEVTGDLRFAGGNLVTASREDVGSLLAEYGLTLSGPC